MLKLLIIDDETGIRNGIASYFPWQGLGIEVAGVCADAAEALRLMAKAPVDLVLCDIRMPGIDGIRFTEIVKERGYPCEVVFISAHKDFDYARRAIELGVRHYIVKPAGYEKLHEVFSRLAEELRGRRAAAGEEAEGKPLEAEADRFLNLEEQVRLLAQGDLRNARLSTIGRHLGMSPNHFSFRFHKETGRTFSGYITALRMNRARELLSEEGRRVYETGEQVGYASVKSFIRAFRAYFGVSPGTVRKRSHDRVD